MLNILRFFLVLLAAVGMNLALADNIRVPILTYHNFNPTVKGSMSITPAKFEMQIKWLKDNGYTVIPLQNVVSYLQGKEITLPEKPVVITADDGWESVYTYMLPIAREYHIPVTLFIYPLTISKGAHALTWNQLKELQKTGLFDIQGHTYWHPNFKQEKKHLTPIAYQKFVHNQLANSKKVLEDKLHKPITLLAWPFGIYDDNLENEAAKSYVMAFSIDDRSASKSEKSMAQPRYMVSEGRSMKAFAALMNSAGRHSTKVAN